MTDKETAQKIGEKMLKREHNAAVMTAILDNIILPDGSRLDWRPMLADDLETLLSSPVSKERYASLQLAIDTATDCSSLLHNLHQHIRG